jgi:hypothetical protein
VGEAEPPRFYSAVLFVSDKHIVVLQLAGLEEHKTQYGGEIDGILAELKVRGCKVRTKACKGPQPEKLSTPAPAATEAEGQGAEGQGAEGEKAEGGKPEEAAPAKPDGG